MIILSDDIIFRKAVIHLLNVELGKFAPAQDLFMMQPDVIELVRKQVCYLLNSDELKAADWNTKEPVFQKLEQMNEKDDKSFIQTSAYLADRLFDIMCDSVEIPSADLLCLSFQTNQEIYYALIKLNYQNSFMHELMKYDNEEIISNIRHKKILPLGKRISEGIIFNLSLQKVMLKEKKYEMLNGDKIYYLTERFLRSIAQTEAKRKYQILSRTIKTINKNIQKTVWSTRWIQRVNCARSLKKTRNFQLIKLEMNFSVKIHRRKWNLTKRWNVITCNMIILLSKKKKRLKT